MDVQSVARTTEMVACFRHEGDRCPRCAGSGYRPRKLCTGCGEPAKALQTSRGARNWEEARTQPLYCSGCNPRFAGADLGFFLG